MSAKGYIISLSLAGTVAALSILLFQGMEEPARQQSATARGTVRPVPLKRTAAPQAAKLTPPAKPVAAKPVSPAAPKPAASGRALTTEELTARAARVEQEANHALRRLVELLDLNESQQDRVFQALVEHSPSWAPGMQTASSSGAAASTGKRSNVALSPGLYVAPDEEAPVVKKPVTETPIADTPAISVTPIVDEPVLDTDPMDEIMALLDPVQQDTLLKDEMDRAAWWAEVLEQITPPDDVPSITPVPGAGAGDVQTYEGSDVLE